MLVEYSEQGSWPVDDLYSFLHGSWILYRTMNDLRLNTPGVMQGDVEIQPPSDTDNGDLFYQEQGELRFGNHREIIERRYIYKFPDRSRTPNLGEVHFDHGGLFHHLDLSNGFCKVVHHRGDDTYRGTFAVESARVWRLNWFVTGPSKEMILDSRYEKKS